MFKKKKKLTIELDECHPYFLKYNMGNETVYAITLKDMLEIFSEGEWVNILQRVINHKHLENIDKLDKIFKVVE